MKLQFYIFGVIFLLMSGIFSVNAQDIIVLKDGNMLEARVMELSPTEIRYKRFDHLDGPTVVIPAANVLSIRYENGKVEVFSAGTIAEQTDPQGSVSQDLYLTPTGLPVLLQNALNLLPPVPVAGNNLKFEFSGEGWIAKINGENFLAGIIEYEVNEEGGILTLKQTHIWPGTAGKTAGRITGMIPGGETVGSALTVAGSVTGAVGAVEAAGLIILEYRAGPPASLKLISSSTDQRESTKPSEKAANSRSNWISFEAALFNKVYPYGFIGFGLRYERMLGPKTSLGLNSYYSFGYYDDSDDYDFFDYHYTSGVYFDINIFFRVYPWGKSFFLGTGLGLGYTDVYYSYGYYSYDYFHDEYYYGSVGLIIIPEIGWKIDVGKVGGFYIMPSITCPVVFDEGIIWGARLLNFGMGFAF